MIQINPFFLRQRSYHFRRNWSYISFPFPFKSSYVFPRPLVTPKNGQIPFLRNTYKIRHYKKDNGNPTINYFIYEFHSNRNTCMSYRDRICNLPSSCLADKDLPPWKGWFIRIDMRVQLHCIARIRVVYLKEVDHLASLMVQSSSRRAPFLFLLGPQRQNVGLVPTVHHGRKDSLSRDH